MLSVTHSIWATVLLTNDECLRIQSLSRENEVLDAELKRLKLKDPPRYFVHVAVSCSADSSAVGSSRNSS